MNEQVTRQLKSLLDANEKEVGFIEYLPGETAEKLLQSIQQRLDGERAALREKIAEGVSKLPAPLSGVARRVLG